MANASSRPNQLLSFVSDDSGAMVSVHADLAGIDLLIKELQRMRELLAEDDCPHTHLFTSDAGGGDQLTQTKLRAQPSEATIVHHVKIYGWNDEWAVKHGLREA